jgi:hypothetical protein
MKILRFIKKALRIWEIFFSQKSAEVLISKVRENSIADVYMRQLSDPDSDFWSFNPEEGYGWVPLWFQWSTAEPWKEII